MRILSLFDGMACGMLAMQSAGIEVDRYVAFEIDKYAVQTASHNFPVIEQRGDVFQADFTEFRGFDFLVGGSPCTYWSIAQKNNRETEASGMGWELFSQYVRALHEAQPKFFIYENNKSMSKAIRESITETFGFEPICINSALVSAQNRQRLYWVGKRNPDGTYSRIHVDQPEDRGILLRDVLGGNWRIPSYGNDEKSRPVTYSYAQQGPGQIAKNCFPENPCKQKYDYIAEPVAINTTADGDKARTLMAGYYKYGTATLITNEGFTGGTTAVAIPVNATAESKAQCLRASCYKDGIRNLVANDVDKRTCVAEPVPFVLGKLADAVDKFGYIPEMWNPYNNAEITDKAPTLTTCCNRQTSSSSVIIFDKYAEPIEWDENGNPTKAISDADGKVYPVYEVKDGQITIKGKQYHINLADGFYIIRKLTVSECKRLQTVPEWYEFPVSDSQAYKLLGNGWTVEVITHLVKAILLVYISKSDNEEEC